MRILFFIICFNNLVDDRSSKAHIYTNINSNTQAIHTYKHTCIYTYTQTHAHGCTLTSIRARAHTRAHAPTDDDPFTTFIITKLPFGTDHHKIVFSGCSLILFAVPLHPSVDPLPPTFFSIHPFLLCISICPSSFVPLPICIGFRSFA